jgi:putative ABC transport system ATP-binding protein
MAFSGNLRGCPYLCDDSVVTSTPPIIIAHDLGLVLGHGDACVTVLDGIDLTVAPGETLALLGPSGSGKSSLLAVLAGLERAGRGTLQVAGQDFSALDEDGLATARRGRIGVVLQAFHLLPTMTAQENVATPLDLAGIDGAMARARDELVAVGLGHRLSHYPAQLSFADEPTGNLDHATGDAVADVLFARAAAAGATLIMVTHDEAMARRCRRVVRLADGRVVSDVVTGEGPA